MKRTLLWPVGLAVMVAGLIWLRATYFSDEAQIRRTLRGLVADASFQAGTGNFSKAAKFNALVSRFTEDVIISVEQVVPRAPPLSGRGELQLLAQAAFSQLTRCQITLHDVVVEPVSTGSKEARAALTATATATDSTGQAGGELFTGQEFNVALRKSKDGPWLIAKIDAVRTLRP